ncbi:MAG: hypothetical protein AMJ54_12615 [Deltaproteobacteria bacterium SG8_13]|nr:MAG: hypothetical protein AMJ54_12615 [Deltaproteobacteria bacterium SG8_13]
MKGNCIGAGYVSYFHRGAWSRVPVVPITAICDRNPERRARLAVNAMAEKQQWRPIFHRTLPLRDGMVPDCRRYM